MVVHPRQGLALCAGAGGLELALHLAEPEYRTVCLVEREAYAAANLVARMEDEALGQAPIWDDVATFDGCPWRGVVDIVTAGYPCQPFSSAGRMLGEADPRHLWPEIRRIISEIAPPWVFLENVAGHLRLGFSSVAADLRELGYRGKVGLFAAFEVGASHERRRLYMLAYADRGDVLSPAIQLHEDKRAMLPHCWQKDTIHTRQGGCDLEPERGFASNAQHPIFAPGPNQIEDWREVLEANPEVQPCLRRIDDGMDDRLDRGRLVGNGVVPLAAAYAYRALKARLLQDAPDQDVV